jgi:xylulose-5-phosphate/fructose-6-phosphate phosphoketolase
MTATQRPPLAAAELDLIDAWWRAANYLSVGQIYLLANPLLGDGLRPEDVKPRLLHRRARARRARGRRQHLP